MTCVWLVAATAASWSALATPAAASPAATVSVQLSPSSIVADGTSTSTATATLKNSRGNPVRHETLVFSASDSGIHFGSVTDNNDGTYKVTLTSSTVAEQVTITATDTSVSPNITGAATLSQTLIQSTTSLIALPDAPVTNEKVTLIATTTSSASNTRPTGTITFENGGNAINGCERITLKPASQSVTVTCQTSLSASKSPAHLTAVFTPTAGSSVAGSTSPAARVAIGLDSTSTSLDVSNPAVGVGASVTYTAIVTSSHSGPVGPSGTVEFLDQGQPIAACLSQSHAKAGSDFTAACTVSYKTARTHSISARYEGDANFRVSVSPAQSVTVATLPVRVLGTVRSTIRWTFHYTPAYTTVLALVANRAPLGATILVACRGQGCPFTKRSTRVAQTKKCQTQAPNSCSAQRFRNVDLTLSFRNHRLYAGARITVAVTHAGWIGKYYRFMIRGGQMPRIQIACLPPGGTRPGVGRQACS